MNIPKDLKYTNDHEWVKIEGDIGTIGLTDYAQDQLSDIVFVEMPIVGDSFEKDEAFGTVEAVKTVADMMMPVGGEIIEINENLEDAPETINSDPFGDGWIVKIKIANPDELNELLDAAEYKELTEL
ncbi:glycine cleavage system protein GcvH [bacterium]|nr:glycine cleavage system protein GcvH [bacterium]